MQPPGKLKPILAIIGLAIPLGVSLYFAYFTWIFTEEAYQRYILEMPQSHEMANQAVKPFYWQFAWYAFRQYSSSIVPLLLFILYASRLITLMIYTLRGKPRSHQLMTKGLYIVAAILTSYFLAVVIINTKFDSWEKLLIHAVACISIFALLYVSMSLPLAPRSHGPPKATEANQ